MGNDFLPHLPSLDISKNGLDNLLKVYVDILLENNLDYILILEDDFGYTSRIELIKFISWLGKIYKVGTEYQVQL